MRKYKDRNGRIIVEVNDLSYLTDWKHRYNWLQRHLHHHRLRRAAKKASKIIAADQKVADCVHRFYFIPYDRIVIRSHTQNHEQRD